MIRRDRQACSKVAWGLAGQLPGCPRRARGAHADEVAGRCGAEGLGCQQARGCWWGLSTERGLLLTFVTWDGDFRLRGTVCGEARQEVRTELGRRCRGLGGGVGVGTEDGGGTGGGCHLWGTKGRKWE